MTDRILRFALFGSDYQQGQAETVAHIIRVLKSHGAVVGIDSTFAALLSEGGAVDVSDLHEFRGDAFDADFVLSLGGDGTFLKAASRVGAKGTPIIGVNLGRLGFLADVQAADVERAVADVYEDRYTVERHVALLLDTGAEDSPFALNDIAILKRDTASMISIRTMVDGEYLTTYQADGLIVSTPTGSTAYSLSNGGPIIAPLTGVLCLTPVAPHSLNVRPIVLKNDVEIRLSIESRSHNFLVAVDGRSEKFSEQTEIVIRKAPFTVNMVKFPVQTYFATLREKMMWGADKRELGSR